jgi:hypothetical protein
LWRAIGPERFHKFSKGLPQGLLNPKLIEEKVPQFASHLETIHGENWPEVLMKTASMLQEMGKNPPLDDKDFQTITCPVLISLGDQDKTANLKE